MRSDNFSFFKAISIGFVVIGHYYNEVVFLWVPAAFGLMIFAYSSAYFTAKKYKDGFDLREYWLQKASRLGVSLIVINIFTGSLSLLRGSKDLWSWQTPIHFFGMTGFLEWAEFPIHNAFTAGRWFLTVLFIFYLLYPILLKVFSRGSWVFVALVAFVFFANWLNYKNSPMFGLWITSVDFLFGFAMARTGLTFTKRAMAVLTAILLFATGLVNLHFRTADFNFLLLVSLFFCFAILIQNLPIPAVGKHFGRFIERYLLEIYLLHAALFIQFTGLKHIDFLLSLLVIVVASITLWHISDSERAAAFRSKAPVMTE